MAELHPLRRALRRALDTARQRAERKISALAAERAEADRADDALQAGELIKAHLDRVPRRADSVELPDLYRPGQSRVIELDPRLKPIDNARRFFKRHQKLAASVGPLDRQLANARAEAARLAGVAAIYSDWDAEAPPDHPPPRLVAVAAERLRVHVPGLADAARREREQGGGAGALASQSVNLEERLDELWRATETASEPVQNADDSPSPSGADAPRAKSREHPATVDARQNPARNSAKDFNENSTYPLSGSHARRPPVGQKVDIQTIFAAPRPGRQGADAVARAAESRSFTQSVEAMEANRKRPEEPALAAVARCFFSTDGFPIYVGRSAADNDRLSLRLANGNDLWLHIAHQTGSHVVARGVAGEAPPPETLLDAAHLAAYFSKSRNASRVEVDWTQAKHVRKTRGAPAGQVTLARHKTISLRLEPARLQRLLAKEPT